MDDTSGRFVTRRDVLRSVGAALPGVLLAQSGALASPRPGQRHRHGDWGPPRRVAGMNVVMFITDQERAIQHFPPGWTRENLPGRMRLERHGLSFENAFTNACMCSPARATLMTGFFPAQHGVKYTLEQSMPADQYPQVEMPLDFENIASVMSAAGYNVVYKGKWHLSKPANGEWAPSDAGKYGFARWDPPDAGANQSISQAGGGSPDNDGRFIDAQGSAASGGEGAIEYLRSHARSQQPFFMVISLVNPHDVLLYPNNYERAGYDDSWLRGSIGLPLTVDEDLSTKPNVQAEFLRMMDVAAPLPNPDTKRAYVNYYGNLTKASDRYLVNVLDVLEEVGLLEDTLIIRTSDHGELGLAHGGLRQKNFNAYEEALRVPLLYSNPRLYPKPQSSYSLVSHVDFLPTLAGLFDVPATARTDWQGVDYSGLVLGRDLREPQDYVVFTYDDYQSGQPDGAYPGPPNHVASIRERYWKLARYYDPTGREPTQWEMYDLVSDPLERENLAFEGYRRTPEQERALERLQLKLAHAEQTRLRPLADTPESPVAPNGGPGG